MEFKWNICYLNKPFKKLQDFLQILQNREFERFEEISSWESVAMNLEYKI